MPLCEIYRHRPPWYHAPFALDGQSEFGMTYQLLAFVHAVGDLASNRMSISLSSRIGISHEVEGGRAGKASA
jgi:hypothetical protein